MIEIDHHATIPQDILTQGIQYNIMLTRTFRIGKLAGIEIAAHWSVVLPFLFLIIDERLQSVDRIFISFWIMVLFFSSIVAHEFGHALVARRYGILTQRILLWPLGGFAVLQNQPPTLSSDLRISVAGPLINLVLAGLAFTLRLVLDLALGPGWTDITTWSFAPWYLAFIIRLFGTFNLILGLTNLLPIYPLDGGRILRDIFEMLVGQQKADKFMFVISVPLAIAAGLIGVFILKDFSAGFIALLVLLGACLLDPRLSRYLNTGWTMLSNRGDYYFFHRSNYSKAIAAYNATLRRKPNNMHAYHNRAAAYANLGQHELALADYNHVLQHNPQSFKAYYDRANAYHALRKYSQAIADYNQAIALQPTSVHSYYQRATTYAYIEQYEQAIADYEHVLAMDPQLVSARANRAWVYFLRGDDEVSVRAELDQAVALQPDDADALLMRGHINWLMRDYRTASADFERAAEIASIRPSALYNLGLARLMRGELAAALVSFKTLAQQMPGSALGHLGSGFVYHRCGNFPAAIAAFDAAAMADPGEVHSYLFRSLSRFANQDIAGATADVQLAVEHDGEKALLQDAATLEAHFVGEMPWARSIMIPFTQRQDDIRSVACIMYGDIARWNGFYEEAIEAYMQAIHLDEHRAEAYMGRALALIAQNQHRAAQSDLTQVIALKKYLRIGREALDLLSEYADTTMEETVKE